MLYIEKDVILNPKLKDPKEKKPKGTLFQLIAEAEKKGRINDLMHYFNCFDRVIRIMTGINFDQSRFRSFHRTEMITPKHRSFEIKSNKFNDINSGSQKAESRLSDKLSRSTQEMILKFKDLLMDPDQLGPYEPKTQLSKEDQNLFNQAKELLNANPKLSSADKLKIMSLVFERKDLAKGDVIASISLIQECIDAHLNTARAKTVRISVEENPK